MRNLKRALSLALASVMLVGLMVVGTGASYSDVTSKQNKEAIEVLQKVGIMVGDDKGNFNPEQKVTRNEMAVVMANLMDYRVSSYKGTAPFTDVPAWAEPYVAACFTNGITSGMSANYYGGSETVTTAQASLMLMKALGYFQFKSDFADDWQLATVKQGNKIDLFDSVDSGVKDAMTRNDVAQLVLNTLESGMVEADDNTINVTTPGVTVEAGKINYNYLTSSKSYATAISNREATSSTNATNGAIVELGEKLYDGDLKKTENVTDDFGRPATKWAYKVDTVGTFGDAPVATYTAKATLGTLYTLLGSSSVGDLTAVESLVANHKDQLIVYKDGTVVSTDGEAITNYFDRNSSSGGNSGKGVITEVYQDDDNNVTLVFINTYVMQATADYSSSKGSVNVTKLTGPANVNSLNDDDFDLVKDVKEDDYILYTYAKGDVQDIAKAEVLNGKVTAYSNETGKAFGSAAGSVTLDGTKYDYAKYAEVDASNGCAVTYTVGDNAAIVVDANGYAIYVDDAAVSAGSYVYVSAVAPQTNLSTKIIADAYFTDGTNSTITLKAMTNGVTNLLTGITDRVDTSAIKGWYSYSKNSKDEYTLKKAQNQGVLLQNFIEKNKTTVAGTVTGNKDTLFVVNDKDDNIKVYTGIANVPKITGIDTANSYYLRDKDTAGKAASVIFVDASNGTVKSTTDSLLYVLTDDSTTVDNTDNEVVYIWKVLLDGVEKTVKTKENTWAANVLMEDYSTDSDGYYETGSLFNVPSDSDKAADTLTNSVIAQSGDSLSIGGRSVITDSNTKIMLVMAPSGSSALKTTIMSDNNADYELALSTTAKNLANTFKGYTVTGTARFIYDDASASDLVKTVYVTVTAAATAPGAATNLTPAALTGANYVKGATATALNGTVTAENGGTMSYVWYSNTVNSTTGGTPVATGATYTPSTATAGITYYYVVATETYGSNTVTVKSAAAANVTVAPLAPVYTTVAAGTAGQIVVTGTAFEAGTYEIFDGATLLGTITSAPAGTTLTFTGVTAATYNNLTIKVTVNSVTSAASDAYTAGVTVG